MPRTNAAIPETAFDFDVFLSHSSKDKPAVRELAARLKKDGLKVWLDEEQVRPGDSIVLRIEEGLKNSRVLVLVMSKAADDSDWVQIERGTIMFLDPANRQRRLVGLRLDDAPIRDILKQFAYIDWRTRDSIAYMKLLEACRPHADRETMSVAAAARAEEPALRLEGHTGTVINVAVTPDRRWVVSASGDDTLRLWDLQHGTCTAVLKGHSGSCWGVAVTPDGRRAVSGSADKTLRVWDLEKGTCTSVLIGHTSNVYRVAMTADGRRAISGANDNAVRVWDLEKGTCTLVLEGHTREVVGVAITPDGRRAVSGGQDHTVRVWDLEKGTCAAVLEGHTEDVMSLAMTSDGFRAVSASRDSTVRVWDIERGVCTAVLEGHTQDVTSVAMTPDGRRAVSGSEDNSVRVWEIESGACTYVLKGHTRSVWGVAMTADGRCAISGSGDQTVRVWHLSDMADDTNVDFSARYTNAKVVLVGESGVGKTGLALRLAEDRWEATESTHGMRVWPLTFKAPTSLKRDSKKTAAKPGVSPSPEREVWLWDFAGQPDYRLVHQLFMDETSLALVVFDPQDDNPFDALGHWEKAVQLGSKHGAEKLLVAARCDRGGITISDSKLKRYMEEHGFKNLFTTAAKSGERCADLKAAIAAHIPWDRIPWIGTSRLFKTLKDAIVKMRGEQGEAAGRTALLTISQLRQRLQLLLPTESFDEAELRTVIGLLAGQGIVLPLSFGDLVLLQPEWLNVYGSAVVRAARSHSDEIGCVREIDVLEGKIDFKDMERLPVAEERILLRAIVQVFTEKALCLRQPLAGGDALVFPSYFRRDRPEKPDQPTILVTYGFAGPLDEIYSTLVVRLHFTEPFEMKDLWKDAADFKTPASKLAGLRMTRLPDGAARIEVYFDSSVPDDTKVSFIKYIHEHLKARAINVTRIRAYICPGCHRPVGDAQAIATRIQTGREDIGCQQCDTRIPFKDLIEEKFASPAAEERVREMEVQAGIEIDNESRELILVGHAYTTVAQAGHIYRGYTNSDHGIDGEIEFKNAKGEASGKRLYLQLKSGDSYLYQRKSDGKEIFTVKTDRHLSYWRAQGYPVMLVVRTSDGSIRWMDVSAHLKKAGASPEKQIEFEGEPFTAFTVAKIGDRIVRE